MAKIINFKSKKRNLFLLILIIVFSLLIRIAFFGGIDTSDSLINTRFSYDISHKIFPTTTSQTNARIGLLIPVSVIYSKFGISDLTSVVLILLTSIGGIGIIYFFGKFLFNENIGLLSAFLLSFFPLDVIYSTRFFSDLPSAIFSALSVFIFLRGEKSKTIVGRCFNYILSGLALGISFSVREVAVVTMLFFIGYVVYQRKIRMDYAFVVAGFLFILAMEMAFFYAHTGNIFYRFSSLDNYYLEAAKSHNFFGRLAFPGFFLAWPYVIFTDINTGYFYFFISMAVIYFIIHRKRETDYLIMWISLVLLYFVFGSTSLKTYAPLLAVNRYLSYATFPGILLLACFLAEKQKIIRKFLLPFAVIFLFCTSLGAVYLDPNRHSLYQERKLYESIKTIDKPIYSDSRTIRVMDYVSSYNNNLNFVDLENNSKNIHGAYVIIDNKIINALIAAGNNLQYLKDIDFQSRSWTKFKEIGKNPDDKIILYYVP